MKINCELPKILLGENDELNDIDFILFHMYMKNDDYRNYFKNVSKKGRIVILDCSAYEYFINGEKLDLDKYVDVINELNPTYYILPDKLMDYNTTLTESDLLLARKDEIKVLSNPMGVLQGNSARELLDMMRAFQHRNVDNICIPFHNSFFKDVMYEECDPDTKKLFIHCLSEYLKRDITINDDMKYALGRIWFIINYRNQLKDINYLHLLGSHCIFEKYFYEYFDGVDSMDTGYPVKCGVEGYRLFDEPNKPNIIIDDFFDRKDLNVNLIRNNIKEFKKI